MDLFNFWLLPIVAFVPLIVGSFWYHPTILGNEWMKAAGITLEQTRAGNKFKTFGLAYLFSLLAAYILTFATVHQTSIVQLFFMDPAINNPTSEFSTFTAEYMKAYGERHRTFGHGVIHGIEIGLFLGLAMIGIPSLFEKRSFKYISIHVGFWVICCALMGGLLCAFL